MSVCIFVKNINNYSVVMAYPFGLDCVYWQCACLICVYAFHGRTCEFVIGFSQLVDCASQK